MCEVFKRLKQLGLVQGKSCSLESFCEKDRIPPDDFIPLTHCSITALVKMQESPISEKSAEELINDYEATQK